MNWGNKFRENLIANTALSDKTIRQNISRLNMFNNWSQKNIGLTHGNKNRIKMYGHLSVASESNIRAYFDALLNGGHPSGYRQHVKTALRKYYDYLIKVKAIKNMPSLKIPIRKSISDKARSKKVLTEEDVKLFRENSSGRNRFLLECMICLGARVHEIAMLRSSDFDLSNSIVTLRSTKTEDRSIYGGERSVPLTPRLLDAFNDYVEDLSSNDLLFKITTHRMWGIVKEIAKSIHLDWAHPHAFRHYCITKFSDQTGEDGITPIFREKELSMMFGVSPEIITNTYCHPSIKGAVDKALLSRLTI